MAIPGQTRLGQGFPGGSSALSPGVSGRVPGVPTFESIPRIQAPPPGMGLGAIPTFGVRARPSALQQPVTDVLPSAKAYRLAEALAIVDRIRKGYLSEKNAARMLKKFPIEVRRALAEEIGTDSKDAVTLVKALQIRPDIELAEKKSGGLLSVLGGNTKRISGNLAEDVRDTVVGAVPGALLAGKAIGTDVKDYLTHPLGQEGGAFRQTREKVLEPIAEQYAHTYGPALRGDPGLTLGRIAEHPLGPALDALSIASAGIGTSARASSAMKAVRDLKTTRAMGKVDEFGTPLRAWNPKTFENNQTILDDDFIEVSAAVDRETGKIYTSERAHSEMTDDLAVKFGLDDAWGTADKPGRFEQFTVIADREGKVHAINGKDLNFRTTDAMPTPTIANEIQNQIEEKFRIGRELDESPDSPTNREIITQAAKGFARPEHKGSLIEAYERHKGITHERELTLIMEDVADVLDNPNLRLNRRTPREVAREVVADLRATRARGKARPGEMSSNLPGFISAGSTGRVLSTGETALREASDLVRAGAIYLRPAYLPNNWASNLFMNTIQQGLFAPVNLSKALVIDKHIGQRYTRALDQAMGATAASVVTSARGRGYVGSVVNPLAHVMGAVADQPFRRAALLHELRRSGYRKLSDVKRLLDEVSNGNQNSAKTLADAARRGQEEIVKFGRMNDKESALLRNIVFVYSWMRGAGRYAGRFPLQHPIQAAVATHLGEKGKEWLDETMGGVPSFLMGAVPVGRDDNGNPILINPFSLNPLGTGFDILRAASGTVDVLKNPNEFNKYADQDIVGLLNPLIQAYEEARQGGNPPHEEALRAIAPYRLQHELRHPGSGGVYPTSRKEAIGKFTFGTLFPRQADQGAITRAVERENVGDRENLIPHQLELYEKTTGEKVPPQLVTAYRRDLEAADDLKKFQKDYADRHGQTGFRNMPPINKLRAAIEWHRDNSSIPEEELNLIEEQAKALKQDRVINDLANALWSATGIGSVKRTWDDLMRDAKGTQLTRERP